MLPALTGIAGDINTNRATGRTSPAGTLKTVARRVKGKNSSHFFPPQNS